MEIVAIVLAVLLAAALFALLYRSMRTYDAGAHATFITTRNGEFNGAIRAPTTLWDPKIKVLRDRHAPDLSFVTQEAAGGDYIDKSLVTRRTGEISLRIQSCTPRPFVTRTVENRMLRIRARVAFQIDVDRIEVCGHLQGFGSALAARIENLFDNVIGEYTNEDVRARQNEIEARVLRLLQEIEFPEDARHAMGMPLGVKFYEATFAYEPVSAISVGGEGAAASGPRGAMSYLTDDLDDLADTLRKAEPHVIDTIKYMLEMQTRQNIVEMLCKSGGLVAFTAQELGLSERNVERAKSGMNIMKPPVIAEAPPAAAPAAITNGTNGGGAPALASGDAAPAAPVNAAASYYGLGAPAKH